MANSSEQRPKTQHRQHMTVPASRIDVQSDEDHDAWPDIDLDAEEDNAASTSRPTRNDDNALGGGRQSRSTKRDGAAPIASTSSSYHSSEDEEFQSHSGDFFVRHRVHQNDSMASLAVKYNVSISDIKRANGYQNDSALYGKEWVIIPKRPLPIDPEHAAWAGVILAHYEGGFVGLDGLSSGQGEIGDGMACGGLRTWNKNVSPRGATRLGDEERMLLRASELRSASVEGREVEMIRTTFASSSASKEYPELATGTSGVALHRADDASHELYDPATREFFDSLREKDAAKSTPQLFSAETTAKLNSWKEKSSTLAMKELKNIQGRSIRWRDTLVNKFKRAESQPSLGSDGSRVAPGGSHVRAASLGDGNDASGLKKD